MHCVNSDLNYVNYDLNDLIIYYVITYVIY